MHGNRPLLQKICNEYAAQTMFCQSQAYPTKNKPDFSGFFISKKLNVCKKAKWATLLHKN